MHPFVVFLGVNLICMACNICASLGKILNQREIVILTWTNCNYTRTRFNCIVVVKVGAN